MIKVLTLPLGFFATILLFLSACGGNGATGGKIDDHLRVSERYQEQGQFRAAIIEAQNAIQKSPGNPQAFNRLAQIYNEIGAGKKASDILLKLKEIEDPELVLTLHAAYLEQKKYQSANALLEKHASLQQSHQEQYYIALAETQIGLGNYRAAEYSFKKALEMNAANSAAILGLAKIAMQGKDFAAATRLLGKIPDDDKASTTRSALKSDIAYLNNDLASAEENLNQALFTLKDTDIPTPERISVMQKLIEILTQQGRSNEAYIYSKKLAKANPLGHELNLKFQNAVEKYQAGDLEGAELLLLEIHRQTAGSAMSGQMLGMVSYLQGDIGKAEGLLSEYVDTETASTETKLLLASAQLRSNKPEQALRVLRDEAKEKTAKPEVLAMYGLAALQMGNADTGVAYMRNALQKNANNTGLRLALAQYYVNSGQLDKARKELEIAYKKAPQDRKIQAGLVETLLLQNQYANAEEISDDIRKKYPKASQSLSLAGHVAFARNKAEQARKYFAQAHELNKNDISALYGLAKVDFSQQRWAQAEKNFKQIVEVDPKQLNAYRGILMTSAANGLQQRGVNFIEEIARKEVSAKLALAEYFIEAGDYKAALAHSHTVQKVQPESRYAAELTARGLLLKSQALTQTEKFIAAREAILSALQIAPDNIRLLEQLLRIDLADAQPGEAAKTLARLQEIAPNADFLHELRADVALAEGKTDEAVESYRAAWKLAQSDSSAGKLYQLLSQSNPQESKTFLQEWESKNTKSPLLLTLLAQTREKAGDQEGAITLYETAIALSPKSPAVLNNLAWLYHSKGDKRALDLSAKAYKLAPGSAAIADTYGWILANNGKKDKAVEVLTYAVSLAPGVDEIKEHLEKAKRM